MCILARIGLNIDEGNKQQYNMVKPNLKGSAVLLRFRDSFGFKKANIKKRKILDLIYLFAVCSTFEAKTFKI